MSSAPHEPESDGKLVQAAKGVADAVASQAIEAAFGAAIDAVAGAASIAGDALASAGKVALNGTSAAVEFTSDAVGSVLDGL